ncbi:MAG: ATP synthase F0 subunit B [Microthrixaceae bacterium]
MLAHLSVLAAEVAEAKESINPVVPDELGEIFWGAVGFFSLWILLRYVCLPPLMKVREQRAKQVLADEEAAAAAETQAEQVRRDYEATLAEARTEANQIVESARAAAEERRSEVLRGVEGEVAEQRQVAMAELDAAWGTALGQIKGQVARAGSVSGIEGRADRPGPGRQPERSRRVLERRRRKPLSGVRTDMLTEIAILASEEGAANAFWLPHDIKEVFWGTLSFLIIVFLLWKFARKPIANGLGGRIERIAGELDVAAQARLAAEAERDRIKAALADSDTEAARIIAEARTSADRLGVEIANRTDADVVALRERVCGRSRVGPRPGRVRPVARALSPLARCRRASGQQQPGRRRPTASDRRLHQPGRFAELTADAPSASKHERRNRTR